MLTFPRNPPHFARECEWEAYWLAWDRVLSELEAERRRARRLFIAIYILTFVAMAVSFSTAKAETLRWENPINNADGTTPLTDLQKICVKGSITSGETGTVVDCVLAPGNTLLVQPAPGRTFYKATAFDTSGNESEASNEVTVDIVPSPSPSPSPTDTPTDPLAVCKTRLTAAEKRAIFWEREVKTNAANAVYWLKEYRKCSTTK